MVDPSFSKENSCHTEQATHCWEVGYDNAHLKPFSMSIALYVKGFGAEIMKPREAGVLNVNLGCNYSLRRNLRGVVN